MQRIHFFDQDIPMPNSYLKSVLSIKLMESLRPSWADISSAFSIAHDCNRSILLEQTGFHSCSRQYQQVPGLPSTFCH